MTKRACHAHGHGCLLHAAAGHGRCAWPLPMQPLRHCVLAALGPLDKYDCWQLLTGVYGCAACHVDEIPLTANVYVTMVFGVTHIIMTSPLPTPWLPGACVTRCHTEAHSGSVAWAAAAW